MSVSLIYKVDLSGIVSIIKENLKFFETVTPQEFIKQIDKELFEYFKKIADVFNRTLSDETEIPEIIDFLRQNGHITDDISTKLLDLLLIIDGLKLQKNLREEDIELLASIADDLEKVKITYPEDYGNNLQHPHSYINVARIKTLNSGTIPP